MGLFQKIITIGISISFALCIMFYFQNYMLGLVCGFILYFFIEEILRIQQRVAEKALKKQNTINPV